MTAALAQQKQDKAEREWRCEHCNYFLTGYRWVSGVFILERERCPNCKKPVKPRIVDK